MLDLQNQGLIRKMNCNICATPRARAYRVAGLLVRYACDDCFLSRCIHCGAMCVDEKGAILPGVTFGIYNSLYCAACSAGNTEQDIAKVPAPP